MHPLLLKTAGFLGSSAVRSWMSTLDYQVAYYDPVVDPAYANDGQHRIYLFWHEYILVPLYLRRNCNLTMLLSQHRDGHVLEQVANIFGFDCVRGSSYRGGVQAIRQMMEAAGSGHLTITPDGPRGPRRKLAIGAIYLASKLQFPLVLLGTGIQKPWRMKSWDRFAVPRPCSRVRLVVSPDIWVPQQANREVLEHFRQKTETLMNDLCGLADDWAESGEVKPGQSTLHAGPKFSLGYPGFPRAAEIGSFG
ncbi:MAG: lysophospholipid acyltransferase family protein [Thermoguttaceae bacterium]